MRRNFISLVLSALVATAAAQSSPPSAASSNYTGSNHTNAVVLAVTDSFGTVAEFPLIPLTNAAFTQLPNSAGSNTGINGALTMVMPDSPGNLSATYMTYTSCDSTAYTGGNDSLSKTISAELAAGVSAIVFYSLTAPYCNISGNYSGYSRIYSMTDDEQSVYLAMHLESTPFFSSTIFTNKAFNNRYNGPNSPGTAVAMIILYAVTGLVTLTFLSIIITGAVRAHRHPERYGSRDFLGRPQNRARGIARAILDTIPIVKFGERSPNAPQKEEDVELAENGPSNTNAITTVNDTGMDGTSDPEKQPAAVTTSGPNPSESPTTVTPPATAGDHSAANDNDNPDAGLGCSICTEDFERGEDLRVLPCNHKFHPACVDPWLLDVSGTCPLCRIDLRPDANNESNSTALSPTSAQEFIFGMPPPLDNGGGGGERRRMAMRKLFAGVRNFSVEERLEALRRLRVESDNSNGTSRIATAALSGTNSQSMSQPTSPTSGEDATVADSQRRAGRLRALLARTGTDRRA